MSGYAEELGQVIWPDQPKDNDTKTKTETKTKPGVPQLHHIHMFVSERLGRRTWTGDLWQCMCFCKYFVLFPRIICLSFNCARIVRDRIKSSQGLRCVIRGIMLHVCLKNLTCVTWHKHKVESDKRHFTCPPSHISHTLHPPYISYPPLSSSWCHLTPFSQHGDTHLLRRLMPPLNIFYRKESFWCIIIANSTLTSYTLPFL